MNDFDPGPGWQNRQFEDEVPNGTVAYREADGSWSYWVREAPLPPLPMIPGTVIAIGDWWLVRLRPYEFGDEPHTWELLPSPRHTSIRAHQAGIEEQCIYGDEWVRAEVEQHGGFEVIAEPRAVTARAVLDRIASEPWAREIDLTKWRREFGAEEDQ